MEKLEELRSDCNDCVADLEPELKVDDDKLDALAEKLAAHPSAFEKYAGRLPLNFGNKAEEINFYVTLCLADDPGSPWRAKAESHFGCDYRHILHKGFMALYISGFDFSSDSLAKIELYDVSSNFDIPLTSSGSTNIMPGVEKLEPHPLSAFAEALKERLYAIGTAAKDAQMPHPGHVVVDLLARRPKQWRPIVEALEELFPFAADEVTVDTNALSLHTTAVSVVTQLLLAFASEDPACDFEDADGIPPLVGFGLETELQKFGVFCAAENISSDAGKHRAAAAAVCFRLRDKLKARDVHPPLHIISSAVRRLSRAISTQA